MIADRRRGELCKWNRDERSPFGLALPSVSGAAPTTTPERLSKSHGLRCLIAANVSGCDQSVAQDVISRVNPSAQDNVLRYPRWPMCSAATPPVKSSKATFAKLSARIIAASRA